MIDRIEQVKTKDGTMEVFVTRPEGSGPFPVLVQIMDGLGMREEIREHARRAASWGYYVLSPDMFYRSGLKGPLDFASPDGLKTILDAIGVLTDPRATSDIEETLKIADADKAARKGKIGVYGFCMGGRLTLVLSQTLGDRVAAGGSLHPGGLAVDDPSSPHRHLDNVKAELYFGIADNDSMATPEQMAELEKALKQKGIAYQLEWHKGAVHGYMMPSRKEMYNKGAAEKSWDCIRALFDRKVK